MSIFAWQVINRKLFVFIVVVPYFVCYLLSLVCSLYVVKVLLKQTRRLNRCCKCFFLNGEVWVRLCDNSVFDLMTRDESTKKEIKNEAQ